MKREFSKDQLPKEESDQPYRWFRLYGGCYAGGGFWRCLRQTHLTEMLVVCDKAEAIPEVVSAGGHGS